MSEELEETLFGLKPIKNGGGEKICGDHLCRGEGSLIQSGDVYFIDLLKNGKSLCSQCGKCWRYARKKADQRGEPIESAEV